VQRGANATLFFVSLIGVWQLLVMTGQWSPILLPSPADVALYLWSAICDGTLAGATAVTLWRLLLGYAVGLAIGLPLGLLCSSFKPVEDTVGTLALGLQALPSIC